MKKFWNVIAIMLMMAMFIPQTVLAQEATVQKIYLVPLQVTGNLRHPKYFAVPRFGIGGIECDRANMDYGFFPYFLVFAKDITPADHAVLILNADVYVFPDNLDQPISDQNIDVFFEGINIPTDWLTPSTTYRELLRNTAGLFQVNQAYGAVAAAATGTQNSIFDNGRTLESNWNSLSAQEKGWFNAAMQQVMPGAPTVIGNPKLRSLAKQAGSLWSNKPLYLGGFEF
jgi:hypothetical protein